MDECNLEVIQENPPGKIWTMRETIRKFGLGYCDLPTMLWNVAVLLRPLILNIDSQYKKGIPKLFFVLTPLIAVAYCYVYFVSMIWFVFWKCRETGELLEAVVVFSLGISSEMGVSKLLFMYYYRNTMTKIFDDYRDCDALIIQNSIMSQNVMKALRVVKKRAMVFWIVIIMNGVAFTSKPLITPGRHLHQDIQILWGLEPMFESPNYEISFILMTCGVICSCYLPATISALFIVLSGYNEAQMLALSQELLNLWDHAEERYGNVSNRVLIGEKYESFTSIERNKIINEYVKENLENIAKKHAINLTLIRQVENVFRGPIAAEFLILSIGLIAQLLGGLENTYMELPFALMQVTMDCLTGQRLLDASHVFENAVYDCKWENFDVKNMKTVLLMLQNSQKSMTLSAGGIATLSFMSLMAVIKTIYSAYTTLRSTMTTNN